MELKKEMLRGTPVKESDFRSGKYFTMEWEPDLRYAWDNGVGIGIYLENMKQGRIIGAVCEKCNRLMIPARAFCELCFRSTDRFEPVADTGTINTFSISRVDWKAGRLPEGERYHTPAVIEIDGASQGQGLMHMINEIDPEKIKIGMRVKAVWKPAEQRTGSITDILYFKPIDKPSKKKKR